MKPWLFIAGGLLAAGLLFVVVAFVLVQVFLIAPTASSDVVL